MRSVPWWTASPAIVAEQLVAVPDPLATVLRPGPQASVAAVAASLAQSLAPPEDSTPAPHWLLPEQQQSFRRALAAVRRHHGAVLADPVGSGKTYVALAVASAFNRARTTACLVPATLLTQWETVAASLNVPVRLGSHEQASRGKFPGRTRGLVVIDESHHFRNRHTKRYAHAARWLVGRPALLVTATPIVNRLTDLGHQLWLAVRDDALALDGIVSLRWLLESGCASAALGQLVVESERMSASRPRKVTRISAPGAEECSTVARSVEMLSRLRLSSSESIAALVRGVLLRAAGSSPAALLGALYRYRRLLLHARYALQAGRAMDRSELHRFTDDLGDQLVWWELLPSGSTDSDLELTDIDEVDGLIRAATVATEQADTKLERLRDLLADLTPTLVFTCSRDSVRYIRERLGDFRLPWCTGDRAGIGSQVLPRAVVLGWFRESTALASAPRHLIVTDVAAEGLDLQRAARVVHYDLPWTPMRLAQREGRAVRLGSRHREVDVVRFAPPPVLERLLRLEATLIRKAKLPAVAGLGPGGQHVWRWRSELGGRFSQTASVAGVAATASSSPGILAGFSLHRVSDPMACLSAVLGWLEPGGAWDENPATITDRLLTAAHGRTLTLDDRQLRECLARLAHPIRERLALTRGRHWASREPSPSVRQLAGRLQDLIREAARLRQGERLLRLERALSFVVGGHTAGEALLIDRIARLSDPAIEPALTRPGPAQMEWDEIEVRLTGLILFVEPSSLSPSSGGE